jgi:hypothetical protein
MKIFLEWKHPYTKQKGTGKSPFAKVGENVEEKDGTLMIFFLANVHRNAQKKTFNNCNCLFCVTETYNTAHL